MTKTNDHFVLSCGRNVYLQSLKQWSVYAGLIEGLPTRERNDDMIQQLVAEASRRDGHAPLLITPVQPLIPYDEGRYPFGVPAMLPAIGCVARFHCGAPARNHQRNHSDLTVIWFQDDFAFPLSEQAAQAIHEMDWETLANDHDI